MPGSCAFALLTPLLCPPDPDTPCTGIGVPRARTEPDTGSGQARAGPEGTTSATNDLAALG